MRIADCIEQKRAVYEGSLASVHGARSRLPAARLVKEVGGRCWTTPFTPRRSRRARWASTCPEFTPARSSRHTARILSVDFLSSWGPQRSGCTLLSPCVTCRDACDRAKTSSGSTRAGCACGGRCTFARPASVGSAGIPFRRPEPRYFQADRCCTTPMRTMVPVRLTEATNSVAQEVETVGATRRERADSHTAVDVTSGEVAPTLGPIDTCLRIIVNKSAQIILSSRACTACVERERAR